MRLPAAILALLLTSTLLAGCLESDAPPKKQDTRSGELTLDGDSAQAVRVASTTPHAVVALIDTGINPYHKTFRDPSPEAYLYPGTYLPDYPADAIALNITLDNPDYWGAVRADCESVWKQIQPNTLYWFPGTKIVGAIYHSSPGTPVTCTGNQPRVPGILHGGGHGTMVASRAASFEYGACRECKIVAVHGFNLQSLEWTAQNAKWIDAQSNSWGPTLPFIAPSATTKAALGLLVSDAELVQGIEKTGKAHLSFWASGNGALTRLGVLGHITLIDPRMTPSIIMVGGHDSGYMNTWPDFPPHVVSDSCNSWAAAYTNATHSSGSIGGGTSGASPFAAGGAARMLLEARTILGDFRTGVRSGTVAEGTAPPEIKSGPLADGKFTLAEWKELVFKTATARPVRQYEDGTVCEATSLVYASTPIQWKDVPAAYPEFVQIGYGAVDNQSRDVAFKVLRGQAPLPLRPTTDAYFTADAVGRQALHQAFTLVP